MTPTTQLFYWLGVLGMSAGSLYFGFRAAKAGDERSEKLYQLNFFICLIASALYLVMATGYGAVANAEGYGTRTVWVRYVTWGLSTPLLVLVLTTLGRSRLPIITALLGADVFMIATGLIATLVAEPFNYVWYQVSTGAYLAIAYLLLIPYRRQAETTYPGKSDAFDRIVTVHLTLWTLYPIVWILSAEGFGFIGSTFEAVCYTVLDVVAKVGFGLLAASTLRKLDGTNPKSVGQGAGVRTAGD
ncbi:bacteriorhodopsin [soil metagenome]